MSSSALLSSSPAMITAVVVPSPTSLSWVLATSTIILAAGCCMSISSSIVRPSLVMVTSPKLSTSILSMPFGPSALLTVSATMRAASMLACWASRPLLLLAPSRKMSTGVPACT